MQLPNEVLTSLNISTSNENISLCDLTVKGDIILTSNGGNLSFNRLNAEKTIQLNAKNGNIQGSILGSYEDFTINCSVKKGKSNLPSDRKGGEKKLSVVVNNGTADINFNSR